MCDAEPCALTNSPSEQYTSNLLILIALHELIIQNKKKRKRIYRINHNWWTLTHLVQITEIRILRDNTQQKSVLNNVHILVHVQSNRKKQNFCALRVFFCFWFFHASGILSFTQIFGNCLHRFRLVNAFLSPLVPYQSSLP